MAQGSTELTRKPVQFCSRIPLLIVATRPLRKKGRSQQVGPPSPSAVVKITRKDSDSSTDIDESLVERSGLGGHTQFCFGPPWPAAQRLRDRCMVPARQPIESSE